MIAKSDLLLREIINEWRDDHLDQKLQGCVQTGNKFGARMFNFAGTLTRVLHDGLEIEHKLSVRIAKGLDGSCMLLIPHAKNTFAWLGYHAWLGGDLGFTKYTVLHTCDREAFEQKQSEKKLKRTSTPLIENCMSTKPLALKVIRSRSAWLNAN